MGASVRIATVDWPRIILDLRGHGFMVKSIARKVGVAPTTLFNLATGATREPCYSVGAKLLQLHQKAGAGQ